MDSGSLGTKLLCVPSGTLLGPCAPKCGEAVENLEHIVHHCLHWNKKCRESGLPIHGLEASACVRLHGLLPAPPPGAVPTHEPALVVRHGVHTVWTDVTAATLTSEDVGLATSLTLVSEPGSHCLAVGNLSLELSSWPLFVPWKSATPGELSVIAQGWLKPCRPFKVAKGNPREGTETSKFELGMPCHRLASFTRSKHINPPSGGRRADHH
eukprot:4678991-Amphidinium_carterae.1